MVRVASGAPGSAGVPWSEQDVTHRGLVVQPLDGASAGGRFRVTDHAGVGPAPVVAVADVAWYRSDRPVVDLSLDGTVVRPVAGECDPVTSVRRVLAAATRWSGVGAVVAVTVDDGPAPVPAMVTAAMMSGARVLVVASGADPGLLRSARRAADVTEALLVERVR